MEDSTSEMPIGTMTWRVRIGMFSFMRFQPNRHYYFQTIALRSLALLMFYCYFFIFLSLIIIPNTILIMFILPSITANNCNLNLLVCFSMAYARVKLSLIVMFPLARLSTVKVYDLVRFKISSVVQGGPYVTQSAIFRHALFFLLVFSCFDYYCNIFQVHSIDV